MSVITSPDQLGRLIRAKRRVLGWDQATLAKRVGVSRQWVIDIEKGKARAELQLVLSTLSALGISLSADSEALPADAAVVPKRPDGLRGVSLVRDVPVQSDGASKAASAAVNWLKQQRAIAPVRDASARRSLDDTAASMDVLQSSGAAEAARAAAKWIDQQRALDGVIAGYHLQDYSSTALRKGAQMLGVMPHDDAEGSGSSSPADSPSGGKRNAAKRPGTSNV